MRAARRQSGEADAAQGGGTRARARVLVHYLLVHEDLVLPATARAVAQLRTEPRQRGLEQVNLINEKIAEPWPCGGQGASAECV